MATHNTPILGLPYPDADSNTQTWLYWQQLAEATESKVTGTTTNPTGTAAAGTGWSVNAQSAWVRNGVITWALQCTRTGANITLGQIADTVMATLPASWRMPASPSSAALVIPVFGLSSASVGYGIVNPAGSVILATQIGADVISGQQYHCSATYPLVSGVWL